MYGKPSAWHSTDKNTLMLFSTDTLSLPMVCIHQACLASTSHLKGCLTIPCRHVNCLCNQNMAVPMACSVLSLVILVLAVPSAQILPRSLRCGNKILA